MDEVYDNCRVWFEFVFGQVIKCLWEGCWLERCMPFKVNNSLEREQCAKILCSGFYCFIMRQGPNENLNQEGVEEGDLERKHLKETLEFWIFEKF